MTISPMEAWDLELSSKSQSTRRQYRDHFQRFCNKWDKTPDEVYTMYLEAKDDPRERRAFQNMVKVHMKEMRDSGLSASTCRMASKAVSSFFEAQGIDFKLKSKDYPRGQSNGQRRVKAEHILEMYDLASNEFKLRIRALIMFLKDSGLRISDVAKLNVSDYLDARVVRNDEEEEFKVFEPFETVKSKAYAFIHIGPEAIENVDKYLKKERRDPKPEEPLFVMRNGKRFNTGALSNVFFRLAQQMEDGRRISAHSFRKYHTTELEDKMNSSWIAKLQGKSLGGSWGPYSTPEGDGREIDPEKLTLKYIEAYDVLRVRESHIRAREDAERDRRINELEILLEKQHQEVERWKDEVSRIWTMPWESYLIEKDPVTGEFVRKKGEK